MFLKNKKPSQSIMRRLCRNIQWLGSYLGLIVTENNDKLAKVTADLFSLDSLVEPFFGNYSKLQNLKGLIQFPCGSPDIPPEFGLAKPLS